MYYNKLKIYTFFLEAMKSTFPLTANQIPESIYIAFLLSDEDDSLDSKIIHTCYSSKFSQDFMHHKLSITIQFTILLCS